MPYEIYIERQAEKDLKKLDSVLFRQVIEKIKKLADSPYIAGSCKITGSKDDWRLRVRNYRILYEINIKNKTVKIMCVKHRREAYRQ